MALNKLTKVQTLGIGSNIEVVGVITTGQFKSGTSNLHSSGVELTNLNVSGIATIGGNVSIGGTLTYQDVTNIDSVGMITARSGVDASGTSIFRGALQAQDNLEMAGELVHLSDNDTRIRFPSNDTISCQTAGTERVRITSGGAVGIGTDDPSNYGGAVKLALHNTGHSVLSIVAGTTSDSSILFADGTSGDATYRGNIKYAHDGDSMRFHTAAAERLRILSNGAVGINTSNFSSVLNNEVGLAIHGSSNDNCRINLSTPNKSSTLIGYYGLSNRFGVDVHNGLEIRDVEDSYATRLRIDNNGHLLVGTTTGGLTDYGDSLTIADANAGITLRCAATTQVSHIYFADGTSSTAQYAGYVQYNHSSDAMKFGTGSVERMVITSGGNVNIGGEYTQTTYPFQLTGSGGGDAAAMAIKNLGSHPAKLHLMSGHGNWSVSNSTTVGDAFEVRDEGANSTRMVITSTGQLLLGETSAFDSNVAIQFRKDNAGSQSRFIFRNRGNNGSSRVRLILSTLNRAANADKFSGMEMYQSGGLTIFNGESDNAHSGINLFSGSWASLRLRNGNVSGNDVAHIAGYWGTSNGLMIEQGGPQSGTFKAIRFTTSHYGGERGYIGVTLGGTSYNSSSDYRMKQDVVDLTGAIDRVKSFKPRRFKWKEDPTYTVDGFLAHEASTVVPESVDGEKDAVDSNGDPKYQVMDNSRLVPVLTAALKEAIAKIETLETKVAALEGS